MLTYTQLMLISPNIPWMMNYFREQGRLVGALSTKDVDNTNMYIMGVYEISIYLMGICFYFDFFITILKDLIQKKNVEKKELTTVAVVFFLGNILIWLGAFIEDSTSLW